MTAGLKRQRRFILLLLFFFIHLTSIAQTEFRLVRDTLLSEFSGGSSLLLRKDKLLLFGDNEAKVLVLSKDLSHSTQVHLSNASGPISKMEKDDLESAALVRLRGQNDVWAFGSGSMMNRRKFYRLFETDDSFRVMRSHKLYNGLAKRIGKKLDLNIEGVESVGDTMIFANRGNAGSPSNHLIKIATSDFVNGRTKSFTVDRIAFSPDNHFSGVSELRYVPEMNHLFFLFTQEDTKDAVNDGAIGDSFLAWCRYPQAKQITGYINLSEVHPRLNRHKVEGLAVEVLPSGDVMLYISSDNDNGSTTLFILRAEGFSN